MENNDVAELQSRLISWFETNQRHFPWRETSDPYAVLVAEKLLQQTAAREVVVEIFAELLCRYPRPLDLAQADVVEIQKIIAPLGFIYRAQELLDLARVIVEQYEGRVPSTLPDLKKLPGVGDYIARAVLSYAYGLDVPVVDTNVARFLYRVSGMPGRLPANPARKQSLIELAATLIPQGRSKDFNLAILDLCAQVCRPSNPFCSACPVLSNCEYGSSTVRRNS